jgi:cyclopropane-fatty-acyl-phospholipid synthase
MSLNSEIQNRSLNHDVGQARRSRAFALRRLLNCLDAGALTVVLPSGWRIEHQTQKPGPTATLTLHKWRGLRRLVTGGEVGFAEAYMDGDWSTPDLTALIELAATNIDSVERTFAGAWPLRILAQIGHLLRSNSKAGSRRNIAFHYDLGNDFYRLWLDHSMTYSSARYARADLTLEAAQQAKLQRVAELLQLGDGTAEVLEIGCGWGALAARLGRDGARVTGLTLSSAQLEHARSVIRENGLSERVELRLQDYRDVHGRFDRIVSIEMLEAVGERYWPVYFQTLGRCLKQGGSAVLQVITVPDDRFERYRKQTDFIQKYIFPGGMLLSRKIIEQHAADAGLDLVSAETFGDSYALTLAEWHRRFIAAWPAIERLGFGTPFRRMWEYYLSSCEACFRAGVVNVGLYVLKKS